MDTTKKQIFTYLTVLSILFTWFFINLSTPIAISFMSQDHIPMVIDDNGISHVVFHHESFDKLDIKDHSKLEKNFISVLYNPSFNHPDHEFHISSFENNNNEKENIYLLNREIDKINYNFIVFDYKPIQHNRITIYKEKPRKDTDTQKTISNTVLTI